MQVFNIPSMSCGHCVGVVTQTLKAADPDAQVDIDLPSHTVRVVSNAERGALQAALTDAGYAPAT